MRTRGPRTGTPGPSARRTSPASTCGRLGCCCILRSLYVRRRRSRSRRSKFLVRRSETTITTTRALWMCGRTYSESRSECRVYCERRAVLSASHSPPEGRLRIRVVILAMESCHLGLGFIVCPLPSEVHHSYSIMCKRYLGCCLF